MGINSLKNYKIIHSLPAHINTATLPKELNNPFSVERPAICETLKQHIEEVLDENEVQFERLFELTKPGQNGGKGHMIGFLIVQNKKGEYGFLLGLSGKAVSTKENTWFVPSLFDDSVDDGYIHRKMGELQIYSLKIEAETNDELKQKLKKARANHSAKLQNWIFEQYNFLNRAKQRKNVVAIFEDLGKRPPSAAGECAAPKLLHFAFKNNLKPLAIAEFWWGNTLSDKEHGLFYPACEPKCRPILTYMLGN